MFVSAVITVIMFQTKYLANKQVRCISKEKVSVGDSFTHSLLNLRVTLIGNLGLPEMGNWVKLPFGRSQQTKCEREKSTAFPL